MMRLVRGLFTAYTGMLNEQKRLDIISNNLANSATVGFKEESVTNQSFDEMLTLKIKDGSENFVNRGIGSMSLGVKLGEVYTNYKQGSLRPTGNTYDLGIEGNGFFNVRTVDKNGTETIRYTRKGQFTINQEGYIVDSNGNHLQGTSGDLQISTEASEVVIDALGNVYADGSFVDTIPLTDFENYDYLTKYGETMYTALEDAVEIESTGTMQQGFTEQSNVNVVSEMVEMITISRAYEANQKVIQTVDGMLDRAVNQVAKV